MTAAAANVSATTLQACRKPLSAATFVYDAAAGIGERVSNKNVMKNEKPFFMLCLLPTDLRYSVLI